MDEYFTMDEAGLSSEVRKKRGSRKRRAGTVLLLLGFAAAVAAIILTVNNTPGTALPSAGGPGTTWLYLLGTLLLLGCGTILVARRRMRLF